MSGVPSATADTAAASTAASTAASYVDLHSHSVASDGSVAPAEVVARAQAAGLVALALTDHDTLGGVAEAQAAGERLGIRIVPGTELSAHDGDREIHLLALHLRDLVAVDRELERFRVRRRERAVEIVARLQALGVPVELDSVLAEAGGGAIGRPHVARALVAGGHVRDHREAFDRYLGGGRPAYVAKALFPIPDAVRLVHDAGGIIVFAHPGSDGTRERIERLARLGLDGLELLHPSHSPDDQSRLGALARGLKLVRSGGSDWHGAPEGPRTLGGMRVPLQWLEEQDERVAARRAAGG